jgi:hypothetical protein
MLNSMRQLSDLPEASSNESAPRRMGPACTSKKSLLPAPLLIERSRFCWLGARMDQPSDRIGILGGLMRDTLLCQRTGWTYLNALTTARAISRVCPVLCQIADQARCYAAP